MYLFAGHGGEQEGRQCIVINEFDNKTTWYKLWRVEAMIRAMAQNFPRSYHCIFFACCREIFDTRTHSGGFKGPLMEAKMAAAA